MSSRPAGAATWRVASTERPVAGTDGVRIWRKKRSRTAAQWTSPGLAAEAAAGAVGETVAARQPPPAEPKSAAKPWSSVVLLISATSVLPFSTTFASIARSASVPPTPRRRTGPRRTA